MDVTKYCFVRMYEHIDLLTVIVFEGFLIVSSPRYKHLPVHLLPLCQGGEKVGEEGCEEGKNQTELALSMHKTSDPSVTTNAFDSSLLILQALFVSDSTKTLNLIKCSWFLSLF